MLLRHCSKCYRWTLSKVPDERELSQRDRKFLTMVERKTKVVDGHYQVPLPSRCDDVIVPNNQEKAIKSVSWQRKKKSRDSQYRSDYVAFVNDIIANEYAQRVSNELLTPTPGKVWYLPHPWGLPPRKTRKDTSCIRLQYKFSGSVAQ